MPCRLPARAAACATALLLTACGGGGDPAPAPEAGIAPADALRHTARAVTNLTVSAWQLSFDLQNTVVLAPQERERSESCAQGGLTVVTRTVSGRLQIDQQACRLGGVTFHGQAWADDVDVQVDDTSTRWSGTVSWFGYGSNDGSSRLQVASGLARGSGVIASGPGAVERGQPMTMELRELSTERQPDTTGTNPLMTSALLRVERVPVAGSPVRDLYGLEGCVNFTNPGLVAELCVDAGSRIALLENVGTEQLTGRIRWNAGTPGGFDARLRVTPGGAPGSTALRVELDLDNNGSFEAAATLERVADIGLAL